MKNKKLEKFLNLFLDKNLSKDDFKYLSKGFYNNVLNLVKQKGFYHYEYVKDFGKFTEELPGKKKSFIVSWSVKILMTENMRMFLMFGINLK